MPQLFLLLLLSGLNAIWSTSAEQDVPPAPRKYCAALPGYRYEFPRDHFSHPCFRTEWWYFTGNLATTAGRRFGFELTFFREAVNNPFPNPSRWRIDDLYFAHFAVSDLASRNFFYTQRMSRAGVGLAGGDPGAARVWNGPWSAQLQGQSWMLEAADGNHRIELKMQSRKPPAIHGKNGISQKSEGEGNASHYYSLTRLETSGQVQVDGAAYPVSGWSWMDHEFSTSQLQPDQVGWDWISLQMEDGTEWMFFQLRRKGGGHDPHSAGSFVDRDGSVAPLAAEDFQMLPLRQWVSPQSGGRYPIQWRVRVPRLGLEAEISAAMPDQELNTRETTGVVYWEGSVEARAQRNGRSLQGRGYLEMTGYGGPLPSGLYSPNPNEPERKGDDF